MKIAEFMTKHRPGIEAAGIPAKTLRQLLAHRLGINDAAILAFPERTVPAPVLCDLDSDLALLCQGKPAAYLFGDQPFLDWTFNIDERALVPRPETEELGRRIIENCRGRFTAPRVLDLCCGSGVLGLAFALSYPTARVTLTDISSGALALAEENARIHGLLHRVDFFEGDLWTAIDDDARFDVIVANPPYVAADDPVEHGVLEFEPATALFSDDQGLAHIKRILLGLDRHLAENGLAAFELGHRHRHLLSPWLDRISHDGFAWQQDPFGVPRYLFYDGQPRTDSLRLFAPSQGSKP